MAVWRGVTGAALIGDAFELLDGVVEDVTDIDVALVVDGEVVIAGDRPPVVGAAAESGYQCSVER